MTAQQLLQAGQLDEAVKTLATEVRDNPTDAKRRTFLFELLCFAGDYARAEKHLDVLGQSGPQSEMGALFYRGALAGERQRHALFEKKEYPQHAGSSESPKFTVTINGNTFQSFEDSDPRIGPHLEAFVAGQYMWIPFFMLSSIQIQPPKRLRDLLWIPATLHTSPAFQGRELGEVLLPVLSPFSWQSPDSTVKLGRATTWEGAENDEALPKGQKILLADDQEWPILELRDIEFLLTKAVS